MSLQSAFPNILSEFAFSNSKKDNYQEYEELMSEFWLQKFLQIWDGWNNLWELQNDDVQINLCKFVETAIICKWDNRERVLRWLSNILPSNPVPEHIMLLERYLDSPEGLEPVEDIIYFLRSLPEMTDPEIAYEVLRFIQVAFIKRWPPFFDVFDFNIVCSVLSANYNLLVEEGLDTLKVMVQSRNVEMISEAIMVPVEAIATNMLHRFNQNQAIKAVSVLLLIQSIHLYESPYQIYSVFLDLAKHLAETEAFKNAFLEISKIDPINGTYALIGATMNMIIAFRENTETSDA